LHKSKDKYMTKTGKRTQSREKKSYIARNAVIVWAKVNKHALWVRPGISSDPSIKQQVVVARLLTERQIFIGL